jgi:hypothetical protein
MKFINVQCATDKTLKCIFCSSLTHAIGRGSCLYRDSLFAVIGDSKDKCPPSLEVQC